MKINYELKINYKFPVKQVLQAAATIASTNAALRIADREVEPIHRFIPAELDWEPKKGNRKSKDDIFQEMIDDRGGYESAALWDSGDLINSIYPENAALDFSDFTVSVASNVPYAPLHQFGGEVGLNAGDQSDWEEKYGVTFTPGQHWEVTGREFMQWSGKEQTELEISLKEIIRRNR